MDPDKYQQAWQAHSSATRVTVDPDLLLKVVQRNQTRFPNDNSRSRYRRSRRGTADVALLDLSRPYGSLPWTWWLGVPAILWVIGTLLWIECGTHKRRVIRVSRC